MPATITTSFKPDPRPKDLSSIRRDRNRAYKAPVVVIEKQKPRKVQPAVPPTEREPQAPISIVQDHRVLEREEERELLSLAIGGDEQARNKIVEHNLRLVAYVAKSYARTQTMFDELYAEGCHVLFHAIERFDLSYETKFSTYATWWIRQAMSKYLQINNKISDRLYVINASSQYDDGPDIDMMLFNSNEIKDEPNIEMFDKEKIILIKDCLCLLTEREADVIKRRFGIDREAETLDQIGRDYDLSKERIRQIQEKSLDKLKPILMELM